MQREGSALSAANFSWKLFKQAFRSVLNELEQCEVTVSGVVGIPSGPSEHIAFSLNFSRTNPSRILSGNVSPRQSLFVANTQLIALLYLALAYKKAKRLIRREQPIVIQAMRSIYLLYVTDLVKPDLIFLFAFPYEIFSNSSWSSIGRGHGVTLSFGQDSNCQPSFSSHRQLCL